MNNFILYSIELAVGLAIFYLAYRLFLYKETHFKLIRFYLIASVIFASLIPKINFTYNPDNNKGFISAHIIAPIGEYKHTINSKIETITKNNTTVFHKNININSSNLNTIQQSSNLSNRNEIKTKTTNKSNTIPIYYSEKHSYNTDFKKLILIIYFAGLCFFLLRFIFNILNLTMYVLKGKIEKIDGTKIVRVNKNIPPFSFLNYIFISFDTNTKHELSNILIHEKIHIIQNHSLDIIFIELLLILQWFNPVIWLLKNAMKRNHEFLADQGVLNNGVNLPNYQYALLNHLLIRNNFEIVSNYSSNDLKARMAMLTRKRSSGFSLLKFISVLPIILFLCLAFSINISTQSNINNSMKESKKMLSILYNQNTSLPPSPELVSGVNKIKKINFKPKNTTLNKQPIEKDNCTQSESDEELLQGINYSLLTIRNGITYITNDSIPYTGNCYDFYDTKEKGISGSYANGLESGKWIFWYKNGQKKMEYQVINGQKNGNYYAWYKNGMLRIDARYNMGEIDELYKCWHENGILKKESCFNNGVPYDSMVYDENGAPDILL